MTLDAVFQLPEQEIHQIIFRVLTRHRVIQEDLIGSVHHEKALCLKDHPHIHHLHPPLVLPTVEVGHQR